MKKTMLVSLMAAGLALLPVAAALAANPGVPDPYPTRESKLLVDFESDVEVTGDPRETGENATSINTDVQFAAEGGKSLKIDMTGVVADGHDNIFTVAFPEPIDIKGYQVLAMDVFIPPASIDTSSWYQFYPNPTTTLADDDTQADDVFYGPGSMHAGWNHLIWVLRNGTDTKLTELRVGGNNGADYAGPIYVDNIRVYKGNFVGLQPDEQLIMGFEKPTDKDLFTTLGDGIKVEANTDKQFVSGGDSSLKIDLTGHPGGYTTNVARADDWGTTIDASKATALHIDIFLPEDSYEADSYHEFGFGVIGAGGQVAVTNFVTDGQWVTLEIPLTPEQAAMLTNVKGLFFITNSGDDWTGPVYVDNLRAVIPAP
jgi:hypothetical protein